MKRNPFLHGTARTCPLSRLRERVGVRADGDGMADDACEAASLTLTLSPQGERGQVANRSR
ncbi:hypothetical protein DBV14_00540 [Variovorax sp. KBW07]|nr:hypothetical protein DBV14_00540 [Variovorax sp. KBW07]